MKDKTPKRKLTANEKRMVKALHLCTKALADHLQYDDGESLERSAYICAVDALKKCK